MSNKVEKLGVNTLNIAGTFAKPWAKLPCARTLQKRDVPRNRLIIDLWPNVDISWFSSCKAEWQGHCSWAGCPQPSPWVSSSQELERHYTGREVWKPRSSVMPVVPFIWLHSSLNRGCLKITVLDWMYKTCTILCGPFKECPREILTVCVTIPHITSIKGNCPAMCDMPFQWHPEGQLGKSYQCAGYPRMARLWSFSTCHVWGSILTTKRELDMACAWRSSEPSRGGRDISWPQTIVLQSTLRIKLSCAEGAPTSKDTLCRFGNTSQVWLFPLYSWRNWDAEWLSDSPSTTPLTGE